MDAGSIFHAVGMGWLVGARRPIFHPPRTRLHRIILALRFRRTGPASTSSAFFTAAGTLHVPAAHLSKHQPGGLVSRLLDPFAGCNRHRSVCPLVPSMPGPHSRRSPFTRPSVPRPQTPQGSGRHRARWRARVLAAFRSAEQCRYEEPGNRVSPNSPWELRPTLGFQREIVSATRRVSTKVVENRRS